MGATGGHGLIHKAFKVVRLLERGISVYRLAEILGCSRRQAIRWLDAAEVEFGARFERIPGRERRSPWTYRIRKN